MGLSLPMEQKARWGAQTITTRAVAQTLDIVLYVWQAAAGSEPSAGRWQGSFSVMFTNNWGTDQFLCLDQVKVY
ncbi:hypothetical protein TSOC_007687 [Tetrabaena socialis]|uniref:Uncharacterized protein n=1 Tax=Tetrabaena socialis TaxID=47790 RepID=A0A2J8A0G3_9CHLO|nr:hypothetical protein TSOC_010161 [Tetrabaena socialis]PNH06021.1 hypothetical protein TSOC_007687 [Tetrabaena socialis]|eukprot:PNH03755.1 hypothetical protein TSOC_010161 [Tetrabaena socialis]